MSEYAEGNTAIGPVIISTEKVLSGTTFDDKSGILKINFNGTETNIDGFNIYPNKLSQKPTEKARRFSAAQVPQERTDRKFENL